MEPINILYCYPKDSNLDSDELLDIMCKLYSSNITICKCLHNSKAIYLFLSGEKIPYFDSFLQTFFDVLFVDIDDTLPILQIVKMN